MTRCALLHERPYFPAVGLLISETFSLQRFPRTTEWDGMIEKSMSCPVWLLLTLIWPTRKCWRSPPLACLAQVIAHGSLLLAIAHEMRNEIPANEQ